ncbi:LrgB family protein, partial [Staphylococcus aureus]
MQDYVQALLLILLPVALYYFATRLQQKYQNPFLNPAFLASLGFILVLLISGLSYNGYIQGGSWFNPIL